MASNCGHIHMSRNADSKFDSYVAALPERRWIKRVLAGHPRHGDLGKHL